MVVIVEGFVLIILSDTTKEHVSNCLIKIMKKDLSSSIWNDFVLMCSCWMTQIRVFADHVAERSEITTGITRIGDYELHDLVFRSKCTLKCTVIVARSF